MGAEDQSSPYQGCTGLGDRRYRARGGTRRRDLAAGRLLGAGDVAVDDVLAWIRTNFRGWLVVEQDILPRAAADPGHPAADQAANLRFLEARGFGGP
jgi:hypothetical protein